MNETVIINYRLPEELAVIKGIACLHCGQDWLRSYRVKGKGNTFLLCAECESVWLPGQDLTQDTDDYLSEFLGDPPTGSQWDMIERVDDNK
ncbi:hypothetical protein [Streptomyces sp. NPDC002573]|uniref:hypothetical protein n=1 Tax=Streptomyces sp. NPDC002573 TaxID=3364651 RepID=UPI00368DA21F